MSWLIHLTFKDYTYYVARETFDHDTTIYKWDKKAGIFSPVKDIGYYRYGFANIGTPVSTDIEKWCISEPSTTVAVQIDSEELAKDQKD